MLEVTAVVTIIACILSIVITVNMGRLQSANLIRTTIEMQSIIQATIDYSNNQGSCPISINQLAPTYMPLAVTSSVFKTYYQLSCTSNMVSVSDLIPTGIVKSNPIGSLFQITTIGKQDNISITSTVPFHFSAKLLYDKKYN